MSIGSLLKAFPPSPFFQAIDIAIGVCTVTLLLGFCTRLSTTLLLGLIVIGSTFQYSLGKIDHGDALYLCALLAMCFQDWGALFSVDALLNKSLKKSSGKSPINHQPKTADLSFLGVLIAFGFLTAGFGKALNWVDFDLTTSGFLSWFYDGYFNQGRGRLLAPLVLHINIPLLWELIDVSAVVFELGVLLAILSRTGWYTWLTIACVFHLMNCLLLNIEFEMNAVVYLAFVPWAQMPIVSRIFSGQFSGKLSKPFSDTSSKRFKWPLAGLAALGTCAFALRLHVVQTPNVDLFAIESMLFTDKLLTSCGIWSISFFIFLISFKAFTRAQPAIRQASIPIPSFAKTLPRK
ncbi:MAG: hypothetical protein WBA01_19750 [Phormidesmis sp.]